MKEVEIEHEQKCTRHEKKVCWGDPKETHLTGVEDVY